MINDLICPTGANNGCLLPSVVFGCKSSVECICGNPNDEHDTFLTSGLALVAGSFYFRGTDLTRAYAREGLGRLKLSGFWRKIYRDETRNTILSVHLPDLIAEPSLREPWRCGIGAKPSPHNSPILTSAVELGA